MQRCSFLFSRIAYPGLTSVLPQAIGTKMLVRLLFRK